MSDVKEKDIPGFEGIYKVTENGDIISCRKSKNYLMVLNQEDMHLSVCIQVAGKDHHIKWFTELLQKYLLITQMANRKLITRMEINLIIKLKISSG